MSEDSSAGVCTPDQDVGPVVSCQAKQPKFPPPQKKHPCYLQRVGIKCAHSRTEVEYQKGAGECIESSLDDKPKAILMDRIYQIVADPEPPDPKDTLTFSFFGSPLGQEDKVTVQLMGKHCSQLQHAWITVYDETAEKLVATTRGQTTTTFTAKAKKPPPVPTGTGRTIFGGVVRLAWYNFWSALQVRTYDVHVITCGYDPKEQYQDKFDALALTVQAYPSDKYSVKVNLKPYYKKKSGAAKTTNTETGVPTSSSEKSSEKGWQQGWSSKTESSSSVSTYPSGYTVKKESQSVTGPYGGTEGTSTTTATNEATGKNVKSTKSLDNPDASPEGVIEYAQRTFEIKRNDKDLYEKGDEKGLLEKVAEVAVRIERLVQIVKQFGKAVPKVGFWVDFDYQLLSGSIALEWQFNESQDHYVYRWWKASVELVVVEGKLSVKYGAKIDMKLTDTKTFEEKEEEGVVEAYIELALKGAVKVGGEIERKDPTGKPEKETKIGDVTGSLGGELSVHAAAGKGELVDATVTGSVGVEAVGELSVGPQDMVKFEAFWRRQKALVTVTASLLGGKLSAKRVIELAAEGEKHPLCAWPAEAAAKKESAKE